MRGKIKTALIIYLFIAVLPFLAMILLEKPSSFEEEVFYTVLAEISPEAEEEAIKAQAVIARTELVRSRYFSEKAPKTISEKDMASFLDSDEYSFFYDKVKECVESTKGEILIWEAAPAFVPYHAVSAGTTRDSKEVLKEEYPYLKAVSCKTDISSEDYLSIKYYGKKELSENVKIIRQDEAGYACIVEVDGKKISGEEFRKQYGLKSSCFSLTKTVGKIRVITKGYGHGLGLSQYTANEMAKKGKTYREILCYFYKGIEIEKSANTIIKDN